MTAGHEVLRFDDLHTASFGRTESGRRPFGESYGLPSHPSTGNSQRSMISIHALLTENALADEFVSASRERRKRIRPRERSPSAAHESRSLSVESYRLTGVTATRRILRTAVVLILSFRRRLYADRRNAG